MLDRLQLPADLRALTPGELQAVADAVRARLIDVCSRTGGHIGAGLGVVELSVALHAAFETPRVQLVWDVGHQGYPHKVLTGRNDRMETIRQEGAVGLPQARRARTTPSAPGTRPPRFRRR
jgi:1-deoxy-D-xylulose-5-phosphate synthase